MVQIILLTSLNCSINYHFPLIESLPLCFFTSVVTVSEISTNVAVEISLEFAKAVNESFIDDSITDELTDSTLTSKIAVNSAAASTVILLMEERLHNLVEEFESSVILRSSSVSPGENNISPIFAVSTYLLFSKVSTSSVRTLSSLD